MNSPPGFRARMMDLPAAGRMQAGPGYRGLLGTSARGPPLAASGSTVLGGPGLPPHMRTHRTVTGRLTGSRLAWVARDGAGGRAWLTWVWALSALCRIAVRRDEGLRGDARS